MLGHLTSKYLLLWLLCCHMSSLCGMFGLHYLLFLHQCNTSCQHQILLLLPLIGIQIVILLRMIRDQKLCNGFMLEITGHDGIQDSILRPTLGYILGSLEKSSQGSCGASTLRGGHCHDLQHIPELAGLTCHDPRPDA